VPPRGDRRGSEVVHELFGANLQEQGRGFYVALELLAIVRGVLDVNPSSLLDPDATPVTFRRTSHDVARRIATAAPIAPDEIELAAQGPVAQETLHALLASLIVTIPGRRTHPKWFAAHLYPFVGELVHYDAVERNRRPSIERYVFRDAGGLVYHSLRADPDFDRRERVRTHFTRILSDSGTALGRVASALKSHDSARPDVFADSSEAATDLRGDASPWLLTMNAGVDRILRRESTRSAKQIDHLMHWIPYCVARHQLRLARDELGEPLEDVPIDVQHEANPLRARSQLMLDRYRWNVSDALVKVAMRRQAADSDADGAWERYARPNAQFTASPRSFFSESLAAVGALNATGGRRHFTFKVPMLEALLAALIDPGDEVPFDTFCRYQLHEQLDVVVDPRSARAANLTEDIDEGVFAANAAALRERLIAIGLATSYSDTTTLLHGEVR
jgi:hypothetical protein